MIKIHICIGSFVLKMLRTKNLFFIQLKFEYFYDSLKKLQENIIHRITIKTLPYAIT